ncbi:MAG: TIGR03668 family PPOX class F420-dependent oxidoreductase [SAR202 cluster bacterium]|jgi:coenzyme F420-0:L-glutamate ligase/coenzyme F420-1:gamma-L-glutamate ligase|nr:MAG: TIGR03668 family PPOX class F420-dependent oxidoreductase [SAR202 cluster bacterium]|tara:strand:+ start:3301 stop:3720 length:420 start_codon:yes stop_codon:yes gene_type:complete
MNRAIVEFVSRQRIGHLATADMSGNPSVIPICFVLGKDQTVYTALDSKQKSVKVSNLKRVTNISENSTVSIVFDVYSEDWEELAYVILFGEASLIEDPVEQRQAEALLREKYTQYETFLEHNAPIIRIDVNRSKSWGSI